MKHLASFAALIMMLLPLNISAENYKIDTSHSFFGFKVKHQNVSYTHGRFNDFEGKLSFDAKDDSKNSLSIKIKTKSLDTNSKDRDKHLKSQDFFYAKKHRILTFNSTSFKKKKGNKYEVSGIIKIRGKKKKITVDATFVGAGKNPYGGYLCGFECRFTIKRSDFGMKYMVGPIGDDVHITISVEGSRK